MTQWPHIFCQTPLIVFYSDKAQWPHLLDIKMLTGLDITTSINPFHLDVKGDHILKRKIPGGWTGYMAEHKDTGPISEREHFTFLAMWLERDVFYGSTCGPTTNYQHFAQALVQKKNIPLGKYLLGAVYQMLHSAACNILKDEVINYGGPWWFVQLWLNMYTIIAVD